MRYDSFSYHHLLTIYATDLNRLLAAANALKEGIAKIAMSDLIVTTFLILITFSLINMLLCLLIYSTTKRKLYLNTAVFWLLLVVNFLIQFQSQGDEFLIIFGYGFTLFPMNLLTFISLSFCDRHYPVKGLFFLSILSILLTVALKDMNLSFTLRAMPISIGAALPLLYVVYLTAVQQARKSTPLLLVYSFTLFLLAIHSINFAIFRMQPGAQFWGWPVAYGLYQLLAVLIPALTLDFNHRAEEGRLKSIIDEKTKDLVKVNEELQTLLQQKQFLFRTVTHDIINPLTAMNTKLELAQYKKFETHVFLSSLRVLVNRIFTLIQQVRKFDNIDEMSKGLKIEEYSLLACIKEVEEMLENRLKEKNLRLTYSEEEMRNCIVRIDHSTFINSVLPNILSNSIKFSFIGGEISLRIKPQARGKIVLCIRDSGIGIPNQILNTLFSFETNISRQGTNGESGSGFGIPILSRIVRAYGGSLTYESQERTDSVPGYTLVKISLSGRMSEPSSKVA